MVAAWIATIKIFAKNQKNYIISINDKRLATKFTTLIATKNPNQIILDARSADRYNGKISAAVRYGHILKAINLPANLNIDYKNKKIETLNGLKKIYANINKDKKIIVYCTMGRAAAINYFVLRELGYDVANYDSSWKEWGNDLNLPIVNPSEK